MRVPCLLALALVPLAVASASAQEPPAPPIPQLAFHLVPGFFHYPAHYVLGRMSGVAVAPNGRIVLLNRGYHPVLEFKPDGGFLSSWGEGSKMFEGAHNVRFDRQGDLWYVDAADNTIYRFDSEGRTVGVLGTNPEPWTYLTHVIAGAVPAKSSFYQETDIGWSKDGSMFVADGYGNSRVAKFDPDGNFIKSWGERGTQPGDFNTPHSLVVDDNDMVHVADRANNRIQTFDTDGRLKSVWRLPTAPWSLCLTRGPDQVMFVGSVGRVYKMDLTGKILGMFGRPGRMPGTIDSIHQIACPDEKTVYLANLYSNRADKYVAQ
ncbi:MAG TPA: peptidyl-alpha-hydroxyglycine alpha-amidating lyase family protein [Rhizomicrobium sp.]|nr:peptidyl-alpha-hydroxyglycine alpha-amidating lyase family protein [Rhizomicrobium sp.]